MASTSPIVGQAPLSTAAMTAEGNTVAAPVINSDSQSGKLSFPKLMKQIKAGADGQALDGLMAAMASPNLHAADGNLPPTGMILPFRFAQDTISGPVDDAETLGNDLSAMSINGSPGLGASEGALKVARDALPNVIPANSKLQATAQGAGEEPPTEPRGELPVAAVAGEISSAPKTADLNPAAPELHDTQTSAQSLMDSINSGAFDKGVLAGASSHAALDAAHALSQGSEKLAQNSMPTSVSLPLKHPGWGDELSNRVMWMVRQDVQSASIKLNPPHLGPIEVKVSLINDQVNVSFSSHHAPVREALDASIPKLKEMLGDNGLQLGDANVTHHSFSGQDRNSNQAAPYPYQGSGGHDSDGIGDDQNDTVSTDVQDFWGSAIDLYA